MDFQPFGEIIQDSNPGWQPFGFAGGFSDRDLDLVHFGFRDYDPRTGRWIAKDPAGFRGGDANLYRYVADDPLNAHDQDGRFLVPLIGGVVGGVSGYISASLAHGTPSQKAAATLIGFAAGATGAGFAEGIATSATATAAAMRGALTWGWAAFAGNAAGQLATKAPNCFSWASALISGAGGALAGAFGGVAGFAERAMAPAAELSPWLAAGVDAVATSISTAVDTVANAVEGKGR
jgi:RHS repeat-associated protein